MEELFDRICNKYHLNNEDKDYIKEIIWPIINDDNFQIRLTNKFPHHGVITLGEHIIEDVVMTYILSKKYVNKKKDNNYKIDLAIKIALLHDLYTLPWQNNKEAKVKHFFDKHGFRHPVEAVINSLNWYPDLFDEESSFVIIDGILHHMNPLPVRYLDNKTELKNRELYDKLDNNYKMMINDSLKRKRIGKISLARSKSKEGKIMAKADRKVSRKQIKDFSSLKSLVTGRNKKIDNH